jgi:hypothetical protein
VGVKEDAPRWLLIALVSGLAACLVALLGGYFYFAFTNPDYLRSERFTLRKLEIGKGLLGDSESGMTDPVPLEAPKQVLIEARGVVAKDSK